MIPSTFLLAHVCADTATAKDLHGDVRWLLTCVTEGMALWSEKIFSANIQPYMFWTQKSSCDLQYTNSMSQTV